MNPRPETRPSATTPLRKVVGLTLLVLYGVGVTVGAGVFVLVGQIAGQARGGAPLSIILAAVAVLFTAFSFGELSSRFPRAAGEAVYVREAFGLRSLSLLIGLLVCLAGIIATAAIVNGTRGYVQEMMGAPDWAIEATVVAVMVAFAMWGVSQSMALTAVITVLEVGILLVIIGSGSFAVLSGKGDFSNMTREVSGAGVLGAVLPCVFAFIGFENMVNIAEEVKNPRRTIPLAILITLAVVTVLYLGVMAVALIVVGPDDLAGNEAPLVMIFERSLGTDGALLAGLSSFATVNGVLAQIVMVSRVLYGLGSDGTLPRVFAYVHPVTATPVFATVVCGAVVLALSLLVPIEPLARFSSLIILTIFASVNGALLKIKLDGRTKGETTFMVPPWVPVAGLIGSILPLGWELWLLAS